MPKVKQFNREKVLQAASEVFRKKGYNGTSIDEILKMTGLSRSSLYDSFKDKHSLYLQALEFYKERENSGFVTLDNKNLNGYEKIEVLFKEAIDHLSGKPTNGCLMVNAAAEMSKLCVKTSEIISSNKERIQEIFTDWVTDAQNNRVLTLSKPPKHYGSFLFNSLCGLKVLSQSGASRTELGNVVKLTLEALN